MRFGSTTALGEPINSLASVSRFLNVNVTTAIHVIKRFISNGNRVVSRRKFSGRKLATKTREIIQHIDNA
jgi:hypothetical protein